MLMKKNLDSTSIHTSNVQLINVQLINVQLRRRGKTKRQSLMVSNEINVDLYSVYTVYVQWNAWGKNP